MSTPGSSAASGSPHRRAMSALKVALCLLVLAASALARRSGSGGQTGHAHTGGRNASAGMQTNNVFHLPMTLVGDKYYYYLLEAKTWNEGKSFCESKDLRLATLETSSELQMVGNWLLHHWKIPGYSAMWTAGTDINNHGVWVWDTTGEIINYNAWAPGEPNNAQGNEHCMVAAAYNGYLKYLDDPCGRVYYVLCESTIKFPGS